MGKNKAVVEMEEKVMKKLKEEVESKGLKLSVTEDGSERKSKMIASCDFLENELRQFSNEDGVKLAERAYAGFRRFRGKHCRLQSRRWRVTKDADFTTVCPESFGETRCNGRAGERGKCTIHPSRSKEKFKVSFISSQKASGKPDALFSSEQGNLIRNSVFRKTNPSNLRGTLLEGDKDHLLNQARSDLAKQELHVESLNKCIRIF